MLSKNLFGLRFGRLIVIGQEENKHYLCKCDCGKELIILKYYLTVNKRGTRSCGCLRKEISSNKRKDLTGQAFGELQVISYVGAVKRKDGVSSRSLYEVLCSCGNIKVVKADDLIGGKTISCGHIAKARRNSGDINRKHSLRKHPVYSRWSHIIDRTENPKCPAYKNYGAKGIIMEEPWRSNPALFIEWFEKERNDRSMRDLEVDRYPNKLGPYAPWNCRLVTSEINNNNRTNNRIELAFGIEDTLANLVKRFAVVSYGTVQYRIDHGWDIEKALTEQQQ